MSVYLHVNLHDAVREGDPRLSADASLFETSGEAMASVRIASGNAKHCTDPCVNVYSSDPERMKAIAAAFLDAATLLESAKLKPVAGEPGVLIPGPNVCERCLGSGDIGGNGEELTCPDCQGNGTKPEVQSALQQDPAKTITHADGVKAEEVPF